MFYFYSDLGKIRTGAPVNQFIKKVWPDDFLLCNFVKIIIFCCQIIFGSQYSPFKKGYPTPLLNVENAHAFGVYLVECEKCCCQIGSLGSRIDLSSIKILQSFLTQMSLL